MLKNAIIPYLYDMQKIKDYWFMQDDARHGGYQQTFDLLAEKFNKRTTG